MKTIAQSIVLVGALLLQMNSSFAGDLFGRRGGCNCGSSGPSVTVVSTMHHAEVPLAHVVDNACECSAAAPACCGLGGLAGIGSAYGASVAFNGHFEGEHVSGIGSPAPGSFISGFENLPNMDGGGIHHRYPYHSYRRPWAFPGTPATNVTIVW
jgi:hypothetical protein